MIILTNLVYAYMVPPKLIILHIQLPYIIDAKTSKDQKKQQQNSHAHNKQNELTPDLM